MTSAVTPPHGQASPTHSSRPVRATEAITVSVSSGLTERKSTTSISVAFARQFIRGRNAS